VKALRKTEERAEMDAYLRTAREGGRFSLADVMRRPPRRAAARDDAGSELTGRVAGRPGPPVVEKHGAQTSHPSRNADQRGRGARARRADGGGRGGARRRLSDRLALGKSIGLLELEGVITDAADAIETLDRFRKQDHTVAVVLRIDSPGGAVAPSQELYDAVWRLREAGKPVVASLGNVAASGGYYVASAAKTIFADPGTITGSIGAIMSIRQVTDLAQKVGISEQVVKAAPFKDAGSRLRPLTPEERALFQEMVDDVLSQFVMAVAKGREMSETDVAPLADGRIYSGAAPIASGSSTASAASRRRSTRVARGGPGGRAARLARPGAAAPWWLELLGSIRRAGR
jgi:signal peptide peptidase SppA